MPTPTLNLSSPYLKIFNIAPNYSKLRVFGCLCYPWLRPYTSHKLESRSTPCIFLGYSLTQSAYYCLDPSTSRMYVSRHVKFVESQFPYSSLVSPQPSTPHNTVATWFPAPIQVLSPSSQPPLMVPSAADVIQQPLCAAPTPSPPTNTSQATPPNTFPQPAIPNTTSPTQALPPSPQNPPRTQSTSNSLNDHPSKEQNSQAYNQAQPSYPTLHLQQFGTHVCD